jgi:hypothetical protein
LLEASAEPPQVLIDALVRHGRRAIGFEIDPETAAKAKERLDAERLVT